MIGNAAATVAFGIDDKPPKALTRTRAFLEFIFGGGPQRSSLSLIKIRGRHKTPSIVIERFPARATEADAPKFLPKTVIMSEVRTEGVIL